MRDYFSHHLFVIICKALCTLYHFMSYIVFYSFVGRRRAAKVPLATLCSLLIFSIDSPAPRYIFRNAPSTYEDDVFQN